MPRFEWQQRKDCAVNMVTHFDRGRLDGCLWRFRFARGFRRGCRVQIFTNAGNCFTERAAGQPHQRIETIAAIGVTMRAIAAAVAIAIGESAAGITLALGAGALAIDRQRYTSQ